MKQYNLSDIQTLISINEDLLRVKKVINDRIISANLSLENERLEYGLYYLDVAIENITSASVYANNERDDD